MQFVKACIAAALAASASAAAAQTEAALQDGARKLAAQLQSALAGRLQAEIKASGPAGAIAVCNTVAPAIATEISRREGVRLTRVSLRTRNPLLGTPDAWEQAVLKRFDERVAQGEKAEALEHAEIVDEPNGRYFRYMKALPVMPLCLNCHGPADALKPEVKAALAKDYPADRATGYSEGQVRGAISLKRPL
jgi:hypothetical protein